MSIDPMLFWTAMASIPGFIALFIQILGMIFTRPKIQANIRRSDVELHLNNGGLHFRGNIFLDIGNKGGELTSITQIQFRTDKGVEHAVQTFEGQHPLSGAKEFGTVTLEKSDARFLQLFVWTPEFEASEVLKTRRLYLWFKELSGKQHSLELPLPSMINGVIEVEGWDTK